MKCNDIRLFPRFLKLIVIKILSVFLSVFQSSLCLPCLSNSYLITIPLRVISSKIIIFLEICSNSLQDFTPHYAAPFIKQVIRYDRRRPEIELLQHVTDGRTDTKQSVEVASRLK